MKGRWTIYYIAGAGAVVDGPSVEPRERVPVVPCNDAAIERAARALCDEGIRALDGTYSTWERHADGFLAMAERALRAAGETPADPEIEAPIRFVPGLKAHGRKAGEGS